MPKLGTQFWGLLILGLHIIGVIGTAIPATRDLTVGLTPVNLIVSAIILFRHHDSASGIILFSILVFLGGYLVEVAGVTSQVLFGPYRYGSTLGLQALGVPLVMGVNWFLLTYAFGNISSRFSIHWFLQSFLAALGMVLLDILIEPVAIALDYWQWQGGVIPFRNYLMWLLFGFVFQMLYQRTATKSSNPMAIYLIISQITYFAGVHFFLKI